MKICLPIWSCSASQIVSRLYPDCTQSFSGSEQIEEKPERALSHCEEPLGAGAGQVLGPGGRLGGAQRGADQAQVQRLPGGGQKLERCQGDDSPLTETQVRTLIADHNHKRRQRAEERHFHPGRQRACPRGGQGPLPTHRGGRGGDSAGGEKYPVSGHCLWDVHCKALT